VAPVSDLTLWKAVLLGVIQGLTEFLPVSSSGHLVLFQNIFGMKDPMISFDIALHAGTLIAVMVYFWGEIMETLTGFYGFLQGKKKMGFGEKNPNIRESPVSPLLWIYILITLVPTGLMAVGFRKGIESAFSDLRTVAFFWLLMGCVLVVSSKFRRGTRLMSEMGWRRALGIGAAQALALFPGISRSGSTILAGMAMGLKNDEAAKFSFLIYIPAIVGAIVLDLKDSLTYFQYCGWETLIGFLSAAVSGYFVIHWLMAIIKKARFFIFGYYCIVLSGILFFYFLMSR
jgi:undecaprenyl-diphosphatase